MIHRPRRLRQTAALRSLVREHQVRTSMLIQPLFICERPEDAGSIASMPGIERMTIATALEYTRHLQALGIGGVLLFGIPAIKDAEASSNAAEFGVVQTAIRSLKSALPEMTVIADLCNCEYTDHGHCGILTDRGDVDNDATVALLSRVALTYARCGVDIIAPSDMMDGRVAAIRAALDDHGHSDTVIMAYSAKYASAFYGPFRDAAGSSPSFGDRRSYQMDPPNAREALREIALDIDEGADIVMIKPGMPYLDIVRTARDTFDTPIAVYNVSGEYAMIKAAAANGWLDEERAVDEMLVGFVRAGADMIITYFALEYAQRHA